MVKLYSREVRQAALSEGFCVLRPSRPFFSSSHPRVLLAFSLWQRVVPNKLVKWACAPSVDARGQSRYKPSPPNKDRCGFEAAPWWIAFTGSFCLLPRAPRPRHPNLMHAGTFAHSSLHNSSNHPLAPSNSDLIEDKASSLVRHKVSHPRAVTNDPSYTC